MLRNEKCSPEKPKGKFVILPNTKKLSDDAIVRCIFGVSFDTFVKEVRENRDGKYDSLYTE